MIEKIEYENETYAIVVRSTFDPKATHFVSDNNDVLQLGYIVYGAGKSIVPHLHLPAKREIYGTPEVLFVRKGKMKTVFYNNRKERKGDLILNVGDVIVLLRGGHGFEMIEDTVLMEVKQGPYLGTLDKEKFEV